MPNSHSISPIPSNEKENKYWSNEKQKENKYWSNEKLKENKYRSNEKQKLPHCRNRFIIQYQNRRKRQNWMTVWWKGGLALYEEK